MPRLFTLGRRPAPVEQTAAPPPEPAARPIELIVGLGNPGSEYAGNRHNVGYWTINRLARRLGIDVGRHGGVASVGEGAYRGRRLVLAKPRTFMNRSGQAVRELLRRYRLEPRQAIIVYDDLDLPVGRVRIRARGGHGGNNGMKSIVAALGTQDFPRIRIGIGRPIVNDEPSYAPEVIGDWVLADPDPTDRALLDDAVARAQDALVAVLDDGIETAMNRFNRD